MKKSNLAKFLCILIVLCLILVGCGDTTSEVSSGDIKVTDSVIDNRNQPKDQESKETQAAPISVTDEDFTVTEYLYEDSWSSMCFLVVTNNSTAAVSISANGIAKDSSGGMIGADDLSFDILGPGETSMSYFYFSDVKGVASVDYTLSYDTHPYYYPVLTNLSVEKTLNNNNVVVQAKNTGNTCAEFVEAHALFFDASNNVIGHTSSYLVDHESQIKPGNSLATQLDSYKEYDHVEVYLTGRSTGDTYNAEASNLLSNDQFEITEHIYEDSYSTHYYIIMKSNVDMPVSVLANAIARDSNGAAIGADSMEIDVLGSGETSIGYFYFSDVKNVASVEYQLFYNTDPYYTPVIEDLAVEYTLNSNNVIVAVTNNGTTPAQFVQAYALFFDAQNNLVCTANSYVVDDDSEIKPGKMLVEQLDTYKNYDHCEVYLTGRAD